MKERFWPGILFWGGLLLLSLVSLGITIHYTFVKKDPSGVFREGKASVHITGSRIVLDDGEGHTTDITPHGIIVQHDPEDGARLGADGHGGELELRAHGAATKIVQP